MSENLMPKVAELLGVEIGEEFGIEGYSRTYRIVKIGLQYFDGDEWIYSCNLSSLLNGGLIIRKKPFVPKDNQEYFWIGIKGTVNMYLCYGSNFDLYNLKMGNCFRTEQEAERAKPQIMAKFEEIRKEFDI